MMSYLLAAALTLVCPAPDDMIWDGTEWHRIDPPPPPASQTNKLGGKKPLLYAKANVRWANADQAMAHALLVTTKVFEAHGYPTWVTSAADGSHMDGSKHYEGAAYDFRTHHVDKSYDKWSIVGQLRELLSPSFQVLFEDEGLRNEHIHIEYDPAH
jgi:hypothetical protein